MAINAVQIWFLTALALVPTKILILRFCLTNAEAGSDQAKHWKWKKKVG